MHSFEPREYIETELTSVERRQRLIRYENNYEDTTHKRVASAFADLQRHVSSLMSI